MSLLRRRSVAFALPVAALVACIALAAAPVARAQCFVELEVRDARGNAPLAPLVLRLADRDGARHELELAAGATSALFEAVACGPAALDAFHRAEPAVQTRQRERHLARASFVLDPAGENRVALTVPVLRRLVVQALDGEGAPLPGGRLLARFGRALGSDLAFEADLGEDGSLEVAVPDGEWIVSYRRLDERLDAPTRTVPIPGGERLEFIVRDPRPLPPGPQELRGTVVDPEGAALPDVAIRFARAEAITSADGAFRLAVDPAAAPWTIEAIDPRGRWRFDPVVVAPENAGEEIRWTARPREGPRVRVRVVDRAMGDPIADVPTVARIECESETEEERRTARGRSLRLSTGENGAVEYPCDPACALRVDALAVESLDGAWRGSRGNRVPAEACGERWTIELEPAPAVAGTVVDTLGLPIAGLGLELIDATGTPRAQGATDASGAFVFGDLTEQIYRLRVSEHDLRQKDGGVYLADPASSRPLAAADVAGGAFVRRDAVARPAGRVCFEGVRHPDADFDPEARPLPPVWARLFPAGDPEEPADRFVLTAIEPGAGAIPDCLGGVPPGKWHAGLVALVPQDAERIPAALVAPEWNPGAGDLDFDAFEVQEGETTRLPALRGSEVGALGLALRDVDARDLDRARVEVRALDAGEAEWTAVPDDRFFPGTDPQSSSGIAVVLIPPGRYEARVRIPAGDGRPSSEWVVPGEIPVPLRDRVLVELERD